MAPTKKKGELAPRGCPRGSPPSQPAQPLLCIHGTFLTHLQPVPRVPTTLPLWRSLRRAADPTGVARVPPGLCASLLLGTVGVLLVPSAGNPCPPSRAICRSPATPNRPSNGVWGLWQTRPWSQALGPPHVLLSPGTTGNSLTKHFGTGKASVCGNRSCLWERTGFLLFLAWLPKEMWLKQSHGLSAYPPACLLVFPRPRLSPPAHSNPI